MQPSLDNETYFDDTAYLEDATELSPPLLIVFTVILISLLIIGLVGNVLVITVLIRAQWQERRSVVAIASTTNAYILNLSAADLLFLVFCAPFQGTVYILNHWPFGWMMCKLTHYCQFLCTYSSIWILTTMSVDRYLAIGHPLKSVKWRRPTQAKRISAIMWVTSAIVSVPWLILYETDSSEEDVGKVACFDSWSDNTYQYRKWMILFGFLIGFLIPSLIIFCMALLITKSLRTATHEPLLMKTNVIKEEGGGQLRRRSRVGWLVFALSLVFFICWLPHNVSLMWLNFDTTALDWIGDHYQTFFIMKLIAHMMTYLNSSINPSLYTIGSNQFFRRLAITCGIRNRSAITRCSYRSYQTTNGASIIVHSPLAITRSTVFMNECIKSGNTTPIEIRKLAMYRKISAPISSPHLSPLDQRIILKYQNAVKEALSDTSAISINKRPLKRICAKSTAGNTPGYVSTEISNGITSRNYLHTIGESNSEIYVNDHTG